MEQIKPWLHVLLADRHLLVREGIKAILVRHRAVRVVASTDNAREAAQLATSEHAHIAAVGLSMGESNALELVRELKQRDVPVRTVVVSPVVDEQAFFRAAVAGAAAFLVEDVTAHELIDTCRRVAAGEMLINTEAIDLLRRRMTQLPARDNLVRFATAQEQRIINLVALGHTNHEIAAELGLAEKTVRNYMSSILAKAGLRNRTELAAHVAQSAVS